jgi:predicted nucleic-acid-binding protein
MKLPGKIVDANVILRFFLEDDEGQFPKTKVFIQNLELGREEALMTEIVFAEIVWVLNKVYSVPRREITDNFSKVMMFKGIKTVLSKEIFIESLKLYAHHSMDIQDIFLAVLSKSSDSLIVTFDKADFKKLRCKHQEP